MNAPVNDRDRIPAEPFSEFPAELVDRLRPYLGSITDDVVYEIQHGIPEYSRPADDTYMRTLRTGVEEALTMFLDRMSKPSRGWETIAATYHGIGRGEANEGRSLDSFQLALRMGARVAWRRISTLVGEDILPRTVLVALGEAMLVHLDEIAEATSAGYTEARLHAVGELQRRRGRLLDLLTADPPAPIEAISDLAHAAQWAVPRRLAVVLVENAAPDAPGDRPLAPPEILVRTDRRPICMVLPDPDGPGRARAINLALRGRRAVVGPTVAVTDGGRSARWAADALALVRRGILPDQGVLHCDDHLATLLLYRDEALVDALAERHLAPLERIRIPHRYRLAETLLSWLRCGHNANEVAARLGIHPQTVRYRLRQLEELFGAGLHDPETQFEMELVLRARQLPRTAASSRPPARPPSRTGSPPRSAASHRPTAPVPHPASRPDHVLASPN